MLPATSRNLLSVQIISTTTLITIILLSSLPTGTNSLPITSKPIESTVENLAWEAWLMVPVGQQQKSRKVTPKSIFIVPQKKNQSSGSPCLPGEHFFENRCIPTVTIDTEKILLTQLTNLVLTSGDYDYDYDEEEQIGGGAGGEKLEGEVDIIPSTNGADEPLKFDIFRDNFPIGSSGSGDSSGAKDDEEANAFFFGERRRRPPTSPETTVPDLETGSSHSYGVQNEEDDSQSSLFVSGIDAILVPAVSETQAKEQNLSFSIYPVVVNTTSGKAELELLTPLPNTASSLAQMLEGESLILDERREVAETEATTTERVETTTEMVSEETTTMELEKDEDVESKTEFVRSVTEETTIPPTEATETTVLEEDATTTVAQSEETSTTPEPEVVSTTVSPQDDEITITTTITAAEEAATTLASLESESQTVKPDSKKVEPSPPVIDFSAELKEINRIVAKKRQVSQNRVEDASTAWTKIIPTLSTTTSIDVSSESSSTTAEEPSPTPSTTSPPTIRTDPLWWLPTGWRVDQSDTERPLLLRFLSALSGIGGSQTKV